MRQNEPSDFWSRVRFGEHDECWPWTGYTDPEGYGHLSYQGERWLAHRLALKLSNGIEPEAACHSCDTPPCCNPSHLIPATRAWNCEDRAAKGRNRKPGVRAPCTRTVDLFAR